jgi:hypothetical protein
VRRLEVIHGKSSGECDTSGIALQYTDGGNLLIWNGREVAQ